MAEQNESYSVYSYSDRVEHGNRIHIEHVVRLNDRDSIVSALVTNPLTDLKEMREKNVSEENAVFHKLCEAVEEWEKLAAQTQRIDQAIEYVKIRPVEHTSNQWNADNEHELFEISNAVYKMCYRVYEETKYDRSQEKMIPVAWQLSWWVNTNAPRQNTSYPPSNKKIAGQERKRFTDKRLLEKYLEGRKKAYSHLFSELSPPIPREYSKPFYANGILLPGYTIEKERDASHHDPGSGKKTAKHREAPEHGDR